MRLRFLARWRRSIRPVAVAGGWPGAASGPGQGSGRHRRAAAAAPPVTSDHPVATGALVPDPAGPGNPPGLPGDGPWDCESWQQPPGQPAPWQDPQPGPSPQRAAPFGSPVAQDRSRAGRAAPHGPGRPPRPDPGRPPRSRPAGDRGGPRAAIQVAPGDGGGAAAVPDTAPARPQPAGRAARLPWYEVAHARRLAAGQRDCGALERILSREWAPGEIPPPQVVRAVDRLAELPAHVQERLAAGLDAIHVGPGGVPDLDHMMRLRGVPLPSGRATWDSCAGAYGERKIIVGTRPSSAPDVMCHEIGHALDDLDGPRDEWQSDSPEFRALHDRCLPLLVSDFHRQQGALGRREFFADAFSAIASRQRPALVDMLGGHTRTALDVMLFFNVRYGI